MNLKTTLVLLTVLVLFAVLAFGSATAQGSGDGAGARSLTPPFWETGVDPGDIHYPNGNVGIGTADPDAKLEIVGGINLNNPGDVDKTLFVGNTPTYAFLSSWDGNISAFMPLSLNASRTGINTIAPQTDLHVSGKTGSVELLLEADTDNSGEADQPRLTLSQDGGLVKGQLGYFNSQNHLKLVNNSGGAQILLRSNGDICIGSNC